MTAPLAGRVGPGASAQDAAEALAAILAEIDAALAPILGPRGVAALLHRSMHLAAAAHPWLMPGPDAAQGPVNAPAPGAAHGAAIRLDIAALRTVLSAQPDPTAQAGGEALLAAFRDLLASLVGPSLTERLLQAIWTHDQRGRAAQDTSP